MCAKQCPFSICLIVLNALNEAFDQSLSRLNGGPNWCQAITNTTKITDARIWVMNATLMSKNMYFLPLYIVVHFCILWIAIRQLLL